MPTPTPSQRAGEEGARPEPIQEPGREQATASSDDRIYLPLDALSERELLFALMDSTSDWLFAKDLQHRFLLVNRRFAAALGLSPREMIGRKDTEFWGEDQCEPNPETGHRGFHADDRLAFAGEVVHNPRDEVTIAAGSVRVFDTVKSPLRDRDGTIIGVLCYCRDVTDRERTTQALRESEERFRTVVGNIPGSVYRSEVQPPYRDLFLSDGIQTISGYAAREYLEPGGPTCGELILPEDRARVDAAVQAALDERRAFQVRYRIRHRDGSIRWVSEHGRATYAPDGTPIYLDGAHIDVTAQVKAEEALREREEFLRAIVENVPECVKILDKEGRILEMNPAGLRMIEAESPDRVRGLPAGLMVVPADRPDFEEMIAAVFGGETRTLTHEIRGLAGTRRTLELHSVPMWDDEHRTVGALLGVARDITERVRAEEARRALERQLRQSQKMEAMGTLAGGIAHDFNNILTAIIGNTELLGHELPSGDGGQTYVAGILKASERARDLVRQVLSFSRQHEEDLEVIELQPIVHDVLRLIRASLPPSIEIQSDVSKTCRPILANASQIQQVLVNLCTNAAHAMRDRAGRLSIELREVDLDEASCALDPALTPGPHTHLSLRDTGHGIVPAMLERIFEPFFTTKSPNEGTGLGLAVVHGIVQRHRGLIQVESQPGRGTTFHLYFAVADRAAASRATPEPPVPRGDGEHVLVVDDESAVVELARKMLERLGYRATGFDNPALALETLREAVDRFDLVLCDLTMPGMDGLELAAHVRDLRADLPVVLTSGFGGGVSEQDLAKAGIRELIGKPILLRSLGEAVRRHVHAQA